MDIYSNVETIYKYDYETESKLFIEWSGIDVNPKFEVISNIEKNNILVKKLEELNLKIWGQGYFLAKLFRIFGFLERIKKFLYDFSVNYFFDYFIIFVVVFNAFMMALDGDIFTESIKRDLNNLNFFFNSVFIFEFVVKFLGFGPLSKFFVYVSVLF